MKKCSVCKIEKSKDEFSKDKTTKDSLQCKCKQCTKEWYNNNKEHKKEYSKEWYNTNKEYKKKQQKEYYENNKERKKIYQKKRNLLPETKIKNNKRSKKRREIDSLYKLTCNIRSLIYMCMKNGGFKKNTKAANYLQCTYEEFYIYIENQFQEGMSWQNIGLWHLDHIYPVSLAESEEHLIQLNHYSNFQPLWASDNIIKRNKLPQEILTYQKQTDIILT